MPPAEPCRTDLPPTAVDRAVIDCDVLDGITAFPADFHLHPKLERMVERRRAAREGGPDRLGAGGDAGVRQPAAGRHAGAPERAGLRPRHLQPAPRRISRLREPAACTRRCSTWRRSRRGSRFTTAR